MLAGHVRVRPMRAKQRITVACLAATGCMRYMQVSVFQAHCGVAPA